MSKQIIKPIIIGSTCLSVVAGVSWYVWNQNQRPPIFEMYVWPLKSGQAYFIRTPEDKRILIDGGTNSEIIRRVSSVLPFYTRRLDHVIVTRPEAGHVTGLVDVIQRYDVGELIVPKVTLQSLGISTSTDEVYETLLSTANDRKVSVREVVAGDVLKLGDKVGAETLFPVESSATDRFKYSKASSPELVMKISYGPNSILVIGESTTKVQKYLMATTTSGRGDVKSNVLVMSKSTNKTNLLPTFLKVVNPAYLIYSKTIAKADISAVNDELNKEINIREGNGVKIVSDGVKLTIEKI